MRSGSKKYRRILHELQQNGVMADIVRIDKKHYEVHVDFEIRKRYRLRRSANKFIKKLFNDRCQKDQN